MTAQRGKDILIKMGDGASPEVFQTIIGLRLASLSLNADVIDITHMQSQGWRELLGEAGIRRASLTGNGVFLNTALTGEVHDNFLSGIIRNYQLILPNFAVLEGEFLISSLDYSGEYKSEAKFSLALESAGPLQTTYI